MSTLSRFEECAFSSDVDVYTQIAPKDLRIQQDRTYESLRYSRGEFVNRLTTNSSQTSKTSCRKCKLVQSVLIAVLFFGFFIITLVFSLHLPNKFSQDGRRKGSIWNASWSIWSVWSPCDVKCGQGLKWRIRACLSVLPKDGGPGCHGNTTESVMCQKKLCSDDFWGSWSQWSNCTKHCEMTRTRVCEKRSISGKTCPGNSIEKTNCDTVLCSFNQLLVQLVDGGITPRSGRVEVSIDGKTWGTVCDDSFTDSAAKVVCKMLNYPTTSAKTNITVPPGNGPIFLDDVFCTGYESSLMFCKHGGWGNSNCDHDEDVGVRC